jgi:hypothetical protein
MVRGERVVIDMMISWTEGMSVNTRRGLDISLSYTKESICRSSE